MPIELIPNIPKEVVDSAHRGDLVLFVGAGVSRLVGMPSWEEFALIPNSSHQNNYPNVIKKHIQRNPSTNKTLKLNNNSKSSYSHSNLNGIKTAQKKREKIIGNSFVVIFLVFMLLAVIIMGSEYFLALHDKIKSIKDNLVNNGKKLSKKTQSAYQNYIAQSNFFITKVVFSLIIASLTIFLLSYLIPAGDNFDIIVSSKGEAIKIDKRTGKLWSIKDGKEQEISNK